MALPWIMGGAAVVKGAMDMFGAGQKRGAAQKAGRDANQARVQRGKAQVRAAWKNIKKEYEIALESSEILERNTGIQIALAEAERLRSWEQAEDLRFDDFRDDAAAYNRSVEDYVTNINFNDISANMAYQEEQNFMDDFRTGQRFEKMGDDLSREESDIQLSGKKLEHRQTLTSDISSRLGLRIMHEASRAESAAKDEADIRSNLQTVGNLRATGAVGRSARKAVQAAAMDLGTRQSMRADALLNRNSLFRNEMKKLDDRRYYSAKGFDIAKKSHILTGKRLDLKTQERAASLISAIKSSGLRKDKIAASKYSADLQARRNVHAMPELRKQTPIPFEAFRPEIQKPEKPSQTEFYDQHMPHLSDENKIYGDRGAGAPGNWAMDVAGIGLDALGAFAGAGGFSGGGGGGGGGGDYTNTAPPGQQYGPMASDIHLKENIEQVGISTSGLNIYEWNYKSAPNSRYRGVMAQEVVNVVPEAVIKESDGFLSVNYDLIDVNMEKV